MLRKIPFTEALLHRVADFHCGDSRHHQEVADWIKAEPGFGGALDDLAAGKCDVWLYQGDDGKIVGFASLGASNWKYPTSGDKRRQINVIPNVAIRTQFQGRGIFKEILSHLFHEAKLHTDREPVVGLFVHPENNQAMDRYRHYGFEDFHHAYTDRETRVTYCSMICKLPD